MGGALTGSRCDHVAMKQGTGTDAAGEIVAATATDL